MSSHTAQSQHQPAQVRAVARTTHSPGAEGMGPQRAGSGAAAPTRSGALEKEARFAFHVPGALEESSSAGSAVDREEVTPPGKAASRGAPRSSILMGLLIPLGPSLGKVLHPSVRAPVPYRPGDAAREGALCAPRE